MTQGVFFVSLRHVCTQKDESVGHDKCSGGRQISRAFCSGLIMIPEDLLNNTKTLQGYGLRIGLFPKDGLSISNTKRNAVDFGMSSGKPLGRILTWLWTTNHLIPCGNVQNRAMLIPTVISIFRASSGIGKDQVLLWTWLRKTAVYSNSSKLKSSIR